MKIGILISGRGSNMVALVDAVKSGEIPDSEVAVVISDKADAAGLKKAQERNIETLVIGRNGRTRDEHDREIAGELKRRGVELVCLAGYMRLLSPGFVQAFPDRIVNIHPSLLPAFPGLDAQKQALEAGANFTGCTVHYVDEHLDNGPVILQRRVKVERGDTVDSLSERILGIEHQLYVEAVKQIAIEADAGKESRPRKYKAMKSIAHNVSHSFVSYSNYVDGGMVIDDLRRIVREVDGNRISIDWIPGDEEFVGLSDRVRESVKGYRLTLPQTFHDAGALISSVSEFRTDIYLKPNKQIAVEGVLTDNRGRTYIVPVFDF